MKVLIVAAHPDDEVLGCGGTIHRHFMNGDTVNILFLSDGVSSRNKSVPRQEMKLRKKAALNAAKILGAFRPEFLSFPDNRLDTIPLLDIVQAIERVIRKVKPETIYTHHHGDLNIDHELAARAVVTACRPIPGSTVRNLYGFEVVSSTEWNFGRSDNMFIPQYFSQIGKSIDYKIKALKCYDTEMRKFPHPRSYEAVLSLARMRGVQSGVPAAEAFTVIRETR